MVRLEELEQCRARLGQEVDQRPTPPPGAASSLLPGAGSSPRLVPPGGVRALAARDLVRGHASAKVPAAELAALLTGWITSLGYRDALARCPRPSSDRVFGLRGRCVSQDVDPVGHLATEKMGCQKLRGQKRIEIRY